MKHITWIAALLVSGSAHSAEESCYGVRDHPVDIQYQADMDRSGGVTADMRDAQARAYAFWDAELNRIYRELTSLLPSNDAQRLQDAQRAWIAFRDAEVEFIRTESISDGGSLAPVVVSGRAIDLVRERVCRLVEYRRVVRKEAPSFEGKTPSPPQSPGRAEGLLDEYVSAIHYAVSAGWDKSSAPEGVACRVDFTQLPGGEVVDVRFKDCPYEARARASIERALRQTPIPYSGFEAVFSRDVAMTFCTPEEACPR